MISNMSGVKYEKLFPKYLHNLHILHTYDFWEKFFWKSNSNGERKHPQMMISRFLHTFYFLLIKWLLIEEDNHPQHPPSSTRINIPHENLVIPPSPSFWGCGIWLEMRFFMCLDVVVGLESWLLNVSCNTILGRIMYDKKRWWD